LWDFQLVNGPFPAIQKTLPLQMGLNEAEFCIVTKYQGSATCKCNIFLWRYDDKIVISDIDGTITKYERASRLIVLSIEISMFFPLADRTFSDIFCPSLAPPGHRLALPGCITALAITATSSSTCPREPSAKPISPVIT
jgi:LNS2 (Lipin/Ned1/Smp2)